MDVPNIRACTFPFEPLFIKKETVIGIIGNTQGINRPSNPPVKLSQNDNHNEPFSSVPFAGFDILPLALLVSDA